MLDRRDDETRRYGGAGRAGSSGRSRSIRDAAVRQWRTAAGEISAEAPDDRPDQRPPQLETPFSIFNDGAITPNNAFFVRYHLADVPYNIDPDKFTLEIKGKVDRR